MPFVTSDDYLIQIKTDNLNQITGYTDAVRLAAELAALEEMQSYIRNRYDVANVFNKTGANRNPLILMYLIDMVLYHVHSRCTPRNIPQIRIDRYDAALLWLEKVNDGKLAVDLPKVVDTDSNPIQNFKIGSNPKLGHQW